MGRYGFRRYFPKKRWPYSRRFYHKRRWRRFPYYRYRYHGGKYSGYKLVRQKVHNPHIIRCRGWEPLGINGSYVESKEKSQHIVNNNWQSKAFENTDCKTRNGKNYIDFVGGWGTAQFTISGLLQRASLGLCQFSDDLTRFNAVRFKKIICWGVPLPNLDYVLYGSTHFSYSKDEQSKNFKKYGNPLTLMLKPGRLFVPSYKRSQKKLFWKRKFYAGSQFTDQLYDKKFFTEIPFFQYIWSFVDLINPIGAPQNDEFYKTVLSSKYENNWFTSTTGEWLDREKYNTTTNSGSAHNIFSNWSAFMTTVWNKFSDMFLGNKIRHAPMCPPIILSPDLECAGFFYNIQFQAAGRTITSLQGGSVAEIPQPGTTCPNFGCRTCITREDLTPGGTISSPAFRRITSADQQDQLSHTSEEEEEGEESETSEPPESEEERETAYETLYSYLQSYLQFRPRTPEET